MAKRILVVGKIAGGTVANTGSREYCSACRRILRTLDELDEGRCSRCSEFTGDSLDSALALKERGSKREFDRALQAFKLAAVQLAQAWENVPGDVLGESYSFDIDFSALASEISGWGVKQ